MRIFLALALISALATGCSKKKANTTPSAAAESSEKSADDMQDKSAPDASDDAAPETKSADPQEGGQ